MAPDELDDDVAGHATPGEVAARRERDADGRVEVRPRDGAHEQDDRHHHQARRSHCSGAADRTVGLSADDSAARADEHEEERAEQLREQPSPLVLRIVEVPLTEFEGEEVVAHGRLLRGCPLPALLGVAHLSASWLLVRRHAGLSSTWYRSSSISSSCWRGKRKNTSAAPIRIATIPAV